jgi:MYXO-CTERM domain-containing protein
MAAERQARRSLLFRPSAPGRRLGAAVVGLLCLLHTAGAHAWVCARVEDDFGNASGSALSWPSRTIPFAFNAAGTTHLDNDAARASIRDAFAVWQNSTLRADQPQACAGSISVTTATATDIRFEEQAPTDMDSVGYNYLEPQNNENVLVFRDASWRYARTGPVIDILALTTLTYNVITGTILDADIEFNTADFDFSLGDDDVRFDLMNTATHEIGHMLGFAHSLEASATMFSSASTGETSKRALTCDDATILWYRYPAGAETQSCPRNQTNKSCGMCAKAGGLSYNADMQITDTNDGHGGCNCNGAGADSGAMLGLLAALTIWRHRRRLQAGATQ